MAIDRESFGSFPALDSANISPKEIANLYRARLNEIAEIRLPHFDESKQRDVFQNYVIRTAERDQLRAHLKADGVETLVHWPRPMWTHAALGLADPELPNVERLCREVLSLPLSAEATEEHVEIVSDSIRSFYRYTRARAART